MSIKYPTQNARTAKRQHELEMVFQKNKEVIRVDLDDLYNGMADLAKKYGVTDRMMRRWAERLGWDCTERLRKRNALVKRSAPTPKKPMGSDEPQAHKLAGLW